MAGSALLALLGALLFAVWVTGAVSPPVLGDPGPGVRWGLPVVTALGRAAAAVAIGALVLCVTVVPTVGGAASTWQRVRLVGTLAAVAWALLQSAQVLLTFVDVVGGWPSTGTVAQFTAFLDLGVGRGFAAAALLTALVAVAASVARQPGEALVALLLSAAALLQLAGVGHAGGSEAHGAALVGLWLHIGAASTWIGGLAVLVLVVGLRPRTAHAPDVDLAALALRYSTLAAWAYAVLALSGVFSLAIRITGPADLLSSGWGLLVLGKVVFLVGLGLVGARHRRHTLPLLARGRPGAFGRLAAVEVVLMATVLGLSTALTRATPPRPVGVPVADAVVELTGYGAPPPPSVLAYLTEVRLEPGSLLIAGSGLLVYLRWVHRVRSRGEAWPLRRTASAVLGVVGFAWATNGGLAVYGSVQFSAQLAQHLILVLVLPITYALAAPITLALRALPSRDDRSLGAREWLLALLHSRVVTFLSRPAVAAWLVVASMALLYLTPAHGLVLTSQVARLTAVLHLSIAGYLFTNALIGADPGPRRPHHGARLVLLLPPTIFFALFGMALRSGTVVVEPGLYSRLSLTWLLDPLADQQVGGSLTWVVGGVSTLALGLLLIRRWVLDEDRGQAP